MVRISKDSQPNPTGLGHLCTIATLSYAAVTDWLFYARHVLAHFTLVFAGINILFIASSEARADTFTPRALYSNLQHWFSFILYSICTAIFRLLPRQNQAQDGRHPVELVLQSFPKDVSLESPCLAAVDRHVEFNKVFWFGLLNSTAILCAATGTTMVLNVGGWRGLLRGAMGGPVTSGSRPGGYKLVQHWNLLLFITLALPIPLVVILPLCWRLGIRVTLDEVRGIALSPFGKEMSLTRS